MPSVGVLSYQGDFQRHLARLGQLGVDACSVRSLATLEKIDALIIPGGESTTIGMLMSRFGILEALKRRLPDGFPVFGTCAGAILLADTIEQSDQVRLGGIDMSIRRNAYGRQIESFEADLELDDDRWPRWREAAVHGVFIRAPLITGTGEGTEVLLRFEDRPVLVRTGTLLAATFHPELTADDRIHRYFLEEVAGFTRQASSE